MAISILVIFIFFLWLAFETNWFTIRLESGKKPEAKIIPQLKEVSCADTTPTILETAKFTEDYYDGVTRIIDEEFRQQN